MNKEAKIILTIYSVGFLVGTSTHVAGIIQHGFLAHQAPLLFKLYWDSLTLLDPLTVLLLWTRIRLGIGLAVLIMVTNIGINSYAYLSGYLGQTVSDMIPVPLFLQSLFGTFVFTTSPVVMKRITTM